MLTDMECRERAEGKIRPTRGGLLVVVETSEHADVQAAERRRVGRTAVLGRRPPQLSGAAASRAQ